MCRLLREVHRACYVKLSGATVFSISNKAIVIAGLSQTHRTLGESKVDKMWYRDDSLFSQHTEHTDNNVTPVTDVDMIGLKPQLLGPFFDR